MATRSLTTACSRRRPRRIMRAAAAEAEAFASHHRRELARIGSVLLPNADHAIVAPAKLHATTYCQRRIRWGVSRHGSSRPSASRRTIGATSKPPCGRST